MLLEDVAPAVQGDQMAGCSVDDVAAAVDELALLHGPRWGDESLESIGWLYRGDNTEGIVALVQYGAGQFQEHYAGAPRRRHQRRVRPPGPAPR